MQTSIILAIVCGILARVCYFVANETRKLFTGSLVLLLTIVFAGGAAVCVLYAVAVWLVSAILS